MGQIPFYLIVAATAATGLLAGASMDQSIKQLPARRRTGIQVYSAYSQAADLGNGVFYYAVLGIGAALLTIAAAIAVHRAGFPAAVRAPSDLAAALAVLHSLATTQAAPTIFAQCRLQGDAAALARLFNRFERWQSIRAGLQVINFGVLLWALTVIAVAP